MLGLNWFEQIVLNLSTCLNVLSSCHVIGWLDIRINKQKEKYYRELIKGIVHFNLMHERIRLLSGEVSSLLRLVFIVMSYQKSCVFFNVLLCFSVFLSLFPLWLLLLNLSQVVDCPQLYLLTS